MKSLLTLILVVGFSAQLHADEESRTVIVVQGASGTPEYGKMFSNWGDRWVAAAKAGNANLVRIGTAKLDPKSSDLEQFKASVSNFVKQTADQPQSQLWIVMIGHGTYDGRTARFNLRGLDVAATQLANWIQTIKQPTVVVNCGASSAPFMKTLSAPNRVIITATKSGSELNFARFGDYLSRAIGDVGADLDKDGQTSLFEAYLAASRETEKFYKTAGRLATEHAILDDNGDGQGVRSDWFRGVRATKKANGKAKIDGRFAHQLHLVRSQSEQALDPVVRGKRNQLELAVIQLRDQRDQYNDPNEYYDQLQPLLVELAELYETAESPRDK
jgi:hypothetical protein